PSPPTATRNRNPAASAARARRSASPGPAVSWISYSSRRCRSARSSSGSSCPTIPLPALGFAMTYAVPNGLLTRSDARVRDDAAVHGVAGPAGQVGGLVARDLLELAQQVDEQLAGADEVARRHVHLDQHVLEWLALRPVEDRRGEPRVGLAAQL